MCALETTSRVEVFALPTPRGCWLISINMNEDKTEDCGPVPKKVQEQTRKCSRRNELREADNIPSEVREAFKRRSKKQGGLHHFGIGKNGMIRAVVRFARPPERHPTALCFHFPSTFLTHRFILDGVKEKIHLMTGGGVTSILFIDRNVLLGARDLDNRWIITLASAEARDELLRVGLCLYNRRVSLRRYDDVLQGEYREYQEFVAYQQTLYGNVLPDGDQAVAVEGPPVGENPSGTKQNRRKKGQKGASRQKRSEKEAQNGMNA